MEGGCDDMEATMDPAPMEMEPMMDAKEEDWGEER